MSYASTPTKPINKMIGPEPLHSGSPGDELSRRPPALRAIAGCIRQLDWTDQTADAAGLYLVELQKARRMLEKLHEEFWRVDGRFYSHMRKHGLIDEQGFEIKPDQAAA
jgi:hypothetical protein